MLPITATASSIYISFVISSLLFDLGSLPYCIESLPALDSHGVKLKMELKDYLDHAKKALHATSYYFD